MTTKDFLAAFASTIRVQLNWERLLAENWLITDVQISNREELGKCTLPWHLDASDREVSYDHQHAIPIQLSLIPQIYESLNNRRQKGIQKYLAEFKLAVVTQKIQFPSYSIGGNRQLVLDGNHRLAAMMLCLV
jgi:hypothetical protein